MGAKVADLRCMDYVCPGDSTQGCGGPFTLLALYYDTLSWDPVANQFINGAGPPQRPARVGNYSSLGCWSEGTGGRALSVGKGGSSLNSLEFCRDKCIGYKYFGAE